MSDKSSAPAVERRAFDGLVELRAAPEGASSPGVLSGYAVVFDSPSRMLTDWWFGDFTETVDRTAFGEPVDGMLDLGLHTRVLGRTNHNSDMLLGTTDAGTLRVYIDDVGVRYEIDLPDTSYGRDMAVSAARGDYRFSSFAFRTLPEGEVWEYDAEDRLVRRITGARLVDVAPVADPAYWASSTGMQHRSFDLDAIRASIRSDKTAEPEAAPDARAAAIGRARAMQIEVERGRHVRRHE